MCGLVFESGEGASARGGRAWRTLEMRSIALNEMAKEMKWTTTGAKGSRAREVVDGGVMSGV